MSRFYETLGLLLRLGKVRGDRIRAVEALGSLRATRREFLNNLIFLYDYTKGGDTVTAIRLEKRSPDGYVL